MSMSNMLKESIVELKKLTEENPKADYALETLILAVQRADYYFRMANICLDQNEDTLRHFLKRWHELYNVKLDEFMREKIAETIYNPIEAILVLIDDNDGTHYKLSSNSNKGCATHST